MGVEAHIGTVQRRWTEGHLTEQGRGLPCLEGVRDLVLLLKKFEGLVAIKYDLTDAAGGYLVGYESRR